MKTKPISIERFNRHGGWYFVALGAGVLRQLWWHAPTRKVAEVPIPPAESDGGIMFAAARANPDDTTARLVLADWFEENDQLAFAALLRDLPFGNRLFWSEYAIPALVLAHGEAHKKGRTCLVMLRAEKLTRPPERGISYRVAARVSGTVMKREIKECRDWRPILGMPNELPEPFDVGARLALLMKGGAR